MAASEELTRLAQQRPALAEAATLLRDLLPCLYEVVSHEELPTLSREYAATKLGSGVPLLRGETVQLEPRSFQRRWLRICAVLERQTGKEAARGLAAALKQGRLKPEELVQHVLAGRPEAIHARAEALNLDTGQAALVLRLTLFPVLTRLQTALLAVRAGISWQQGYCPVCGSWPLLGEFRGLEQMRFLRCGLCAAEWELPRLVCPSCGNHDHQALGYLHVEGEETKHRAATCDLCRSYIKLISSLTELTPPQLLVTDLATTHLDLAAAGHGYAMLA